MWFSYEWWRCSPGRKLFFLIWIFFLIIFMDTKKMNIFLNEYSRSFKKWTYFTVGQFIHLEPKKLANYVLFNYILWLFSSEILGCKYLTLNVSRMRALWELPQNIVDKSHVWQVMTCHKNRTKLNLFWNLRTAFSCFTGPIIWAAREQPQLYFRWAGSVLAQ